MNHIFVSYSRKDQEFVKKLHAALQEQDRNTWIDWQDILPTEKWWQAIEAGIEKADTFIFIISPDSVKSQVCTQEVNHAIKHHKRLVPIVHRDINDQEVHPALSAHNWLFMRAEDDFAQAFKHLLNAIDTDLVYARAHTRLLVRALEWEREGRDDSFLLRGKDLADSERWLKQSANKRPSPTEIQLQYLAASRVLPYRRIRRRSVLLCSVAVTALVMLARILGGLQPLELAAYDQLMRLRPGEPQDDRFLIIEVTEPDIQLLLQNYKGGKGTVPDPALDRLLEILQQAQPRLIGLDIYRDYAAEPALAARLAQMQNLIAVCKLTSDRAGQRQDGTIPPPEIKNLERIGFADFVDDGQSMVRRQLLLHAADSRCTTDQSFSLVLARKYLEAEGRSADLPAYSGNGYESDVRIGDTAFPQILGFAGGYQTIDYSGYQTMLNYRTYQGKAGDFAQRVSLQQVLEGEVQAQEMRDRIVMIGVAAKSSAEADNWYTPYGSMSGAVVQAQMVSQILSAVLNDRPLIRWWSLGTETLWIFGWSLAGGLIFWRFYRPLPLALTGIAASAGLCGVCYWMLAVPGVWIPLVPPAVALIVTGGSVGYLTYRIRKL